MGKNDNKVELQIKFKPDALTIPEASSLCKRGKDQLYTAIRTHDLNYGEIPGLKGKIIIKDAVWKEYLANCKRLDKEKEGK